MELTDSGLVLGIAATTFGITAIGVATDFIIRKRAAKQQENEGQEGQEVQQGLRRVIPRFWVGCLLVTSYLMLIPGLSLTLFQAEIKASVGHGLQMPITEQEENMFGLVDTLVKEGLWLGASLVTIYAFVVPLVKAGLLVVLGVTWRQSGDVKNIWRNRVVAVVQTVSKWAAPDMFAYILLSCLLHSLDQRPRLEAEMTMGVGFTCFCLFCAGSTISALGIRRNPESTVGNQDVVNFGVFAHLSLACKERAPHFELSRRARVCLLTLMSVLFVGLMVVGLTEASMKMVLDMDLLYESNPTFKMFRRVIERLDLEDLFDKEVSMWGCLTDLHSRALMGHANEGVAFAMLAVFAVTMPIASFLALVVAGLCDLMGDNYGAMAADARKCARTVGHLSMLDVSIMGSIVVALSLRSWREKGCVVELGSGVPFLVGAELCRYAVFHLVMHENSQGNSSDSSKAGSGTPQNVTQEAANAVEDLEHGSDEPLPQAAEGRDGQLQEGGEQSPQGTKHGSEQVVDGDGDQLQERDRV